MEKEVKFRIEYYYQPDEVVEFIGSNLREFGLTIIDDGEGGDGWMDYKIVKINDQKEKVE